MSDTHAPKERETREVVLRRDVNGEPSWTATMYVPSADLIALGTSRLEDLREDDPVGAIEAIQDMLQLFVRPLIVHADDARRIDRELYRRAHQDGNWMLWLLKVAIFGDCDADEGNREQRRARSGGGGRGGRRGARNRHR